MDVSVIVRSKDEADRLALTLAALAAQSVRPEVVVVNDGSTDHTAKVLSPARSMLPLVRIDHSRPTGRAAGLSDTPSIPQAARIASLPALAAAAARIEPGLTQDRAVAEHLQLSGVLEASPA